MVDPFFMFQTTWHIVEALKMTMRDGRASPVMTLGRGISFTPTSSRYDDDDNLKLKYETTTTIYRWRA